MIKLENIDKIVTLMKRRITILNSINFCVDKGEYVAIIGKSGAGKSTLLNILCGIDKPTSGNYYYEDKLVKSDDDYCKLRNNKISVIMQNFALVENISVLNNILLKTNNKIHALEALDRVGIKHLAKTRVSLISGGEKQRVAIARALVNSCECLLADEPTGSLDSKNSDEIKMLLKKLNAEGVTIILVTHDHEFANQANRIVELRDGCIIEDRLITK